MVAIGRMYPEVRCSIQSSRTALEILEDENFSSLEYRNFALHLPSLDLFHWSPGHINLVGTFRCEGNLFVLKTCSLIS